jgi:hypothetical protein
MISDKIFGLNKIYNYFFEKINNNFIQQELPRTDLGVFGHPLLKLPDNPKPGTPSWDAYWFIENQYQEYNYTNTFMGYVIAHEIGHLLGLSHEDVDINTKIIVPPQLMSSSFDFSLDYKIPSISIARTLSQIKNQTTVTVLNKPENAESEIWELE